jgi:hypothetical protein
MNFHTNVEQRNKTHFICVTLTFPNLIILDVILKNKQMHQNVSAMRAFPNLSGIKK